MCPWVLLIQVVAGFLIQVNPNLGGGWRVSGIVLNNTAVYQLRFGQIKVSLTGTVFPTGCWFLSAALPGDRGCPGCPYLLQTQSRWSWRRGPGAWGLEGVCLGHRGFHPDLNSFKKKKKGQNSLTLKFGQSREP